MNRSLLFAALWLPLPLLLPPGLKMPGFPTPSVQRDAQGEARVMGFLRFLRELEKGGVRGLDDVELVDNSYAIIRRESLGVLAAWLEAACQSVGLDLQTARQGRYDGAAYARLLEVAVSLAAVREHGRPLAMPIGVIICQRTSSWGSLPGDGQRDAYVLIATESGLIVYDPPTRQVTNLANFPNRADVYKIQF